MLATGRDLRAIAAIQQRFLDSQQEMERGYWRARQSETRYRLLFQVATDAVVVVDAESLHIIEANQAAAQMFGVAPGQLRERHASFAFEHHSRGAVNELLGSARATGQSGEIRARLQGSLMTTSVAATPFRADDAMRLLVRVREVSSAPPSASLNLTLSRLVDDTRDGVVVTDSSGRVLLANPAFLALVERSHESDVKGQPLMAWIGLTDEPLAALLAKVRRDGIARHVDARIRHADAAPVAVEISAALLTEGDQECIGFTMRPIAADAPGANGASAAKVDAQAGGSLREGLEQLVAQLGTQGLPMLLREATALAERHFVLIAMARSAGDLTAAAELLGVSRDSLLRRRRRPAGAARDEQGSASRTDEF